MPECEYVQMPQDDMAQIDQVGREYSSDPAKGLAHGVQKDAIQNGFGARAEIREVEACRTWSMTFELKQIAGRDALVFWDEGTVGLTGDILNPYQIRERFAANNLGPDQRLGRFLARFVSGDNVGAGSFGRGKLVFHAASTTTNILVDSLRATDGVYIALDRKVEGGTLLQPKLPFINATAKDFIADKTQGALTPLAKPGTRITILDVKPEIVEAFLHSFSETPSVYSASLAHMIEETWWEVVHRFDADIYLRHNDRLLRVKLTDPITTICEAEDNQEGVRVHTKTNIPINAGGNPYRIKEVRLVVLPGNVEEEFRDIWIQRKRMKIGSIIRGLDPHARIAKRLAGYVILESNLENLVEQYEGTTHYGFDLRGNGIRQIRDTVRYELRDFERILGLAPATEDAEARRRLLDSMKELNELATELGLVTQQNTGLDQPDIEILVEEMILPQAGTLRVEIGDQVGPITYKLENKTAQPWTGTFRLKTRQPGQDETEIYARNLTLNAGEGRILTIDPFLLTRDRYENGQPLRLEAIFVKTDSTEVLGRCVKTIYLGINPSTVEKPPVSLSLFCKFPRSETRRTEVAEIIRGIKLKATNNSPHALTVDISAAVRHLENKKTGRLTLPLFDLLNMQDLTLTPQQDRVFYIDDLLITPERFCTVLQTLADVAERTCDIFATVKLSYASPELNKPKKWRLDKRSIVFYIEVDPPGHSIFREVGSQDEPMNGKQSCHHGNQDDGYTFVLNSGHSAYKFIKNKDVPPIEKRYEQEQMIRQAYLIAFENDYYKGPAEEYKDQFLNGDLSAKEIAEIFDTIIGKALNKL